MVGRHAPVGKRASNQARLYPREEGAGLYFTLVVGCFSIFTFTFIDWEEGWIPAVFVVLMVRALKNFE